MSLVRIQSPRPTFAFTHIADRATVGKPHTMIAVPIRYRRQMKGMFAQKLQHAVPSFVVFGDGLDHLSHEPRLADLVLGGFEVVASVLVIGSVLRGFQQLRKQVSKDHLDEHHAHGVDWIDISLGVMLLVEAYSKYRATGHRPGPTLLLAAAMFTIGSLHGRLGAWGDRRRQLRVSADGISVPRRKFLRMTLPWAQVASIESDDRYAVITAIDGRTGRIDMQDVFHPTAVRDALMSARTFLDDARHASRASIESAATDA